MSLWMSMARCVAIIKTAAGGLRRFLDGRNIWINMTDHMSVQRQGVVEPSILRSTSSPPLYPKVSLTQPRVVKKATERRPSGE
jgi:hypothetical protein